MSEVSRINVSKRRALLFTINPMEGSYRSLGQAFKDIRNITRSLEKHGIFTIKTRQNRYYLSIENDEVIHVKKESRQSDTRHCLKTTIKGIIAPSADRFKEYALKEQICAARIKSRNKITGNNHKKIIQNEAKQQYPTQKPLHPELQKLKEEEMVQLKTEFRTDVKKLVSRSRPARLKSRVKMNLRVTTLVALVDPDANTTAQKHAAARSSVFIFSAAALPLR